MIRYSMHPKKLLHLHRLGQGIEPGLKKAMGQVGRLVRKRIKMNLSGRILQVRSGRLRRGGGLDIRKIPVGWRAALGVDLGDVPYARIQALGGWTGRGHATKIPKSSYERRALVQEKSRIRNLLERFWGGIVRSA